MAGGEPSAEPVEGLLKRFAAAVEQGDGHRVLSRHEGHRAAPGKVRRFVFRVEGHPDPTGSQVFPGHYGLAPFRRRVHGGEVLAQAEVQADVDVAERLVEA